MLAMACVAEACRTRTARCSTGCPISASDETPHLFLAGFLLPVTSDLSPLTNHLSPFTYYLLPGANYPLPVRCYLWGYPCLPLHCQSACRRQIYWILIFIGTPPVYSAISRIPALQHSLADVSRWGTGMYILIVFGKSCAPRSCMH